MDDDESAGEKAEASPSRSLVVGVGGCGCAAVNHRVRQGLPGVGFAAIDSDAEERALTLATERLQIGSDLTSGRGAQADPSVGREAAQADRGSIDTLLSDRAMVIAVSGFGGGTGSGATSVVCDAACETGAVTMAVVTLPFAFEGPVWRRRA